MSAAFNIVKYFSKLTLRDHLFCSVTHLCIQFLLFPNSSSSEASNINPLGPIWGPILSEEHQMIGNRGHCSLDHTIL